MQWMFYDCVPANSGTNRLAVVIQAEFTVIQSNISGKFKYQ